MGNIKVYVLEYDLHIVSAMTSTIRETEHRKESFTDWQEFVSAVENVSGDKEVCGIHYIENIKTYIGEVHEI